MKIICAICAQTLHHHQIFSDSLDFLTDRNHSLRKRHDHSFRKKYLLKIKNVIYEGLMALAILWLCFSALDVELCIDI